jgi:alpha-beta hydrolase superfamily lysophospholipase
MLSHYLLFPFLFSQGRKLNVLYQTDSPGDWGQMQATATVQVATEKWAASDNTSLFVRSWLVESTTVLLIVHGLGGHSGWYIDMANTLARNGICVYAMDLRGFGRSGGMRGHVDNYRMYVNDVLTVLREIRQRHPDAHLHLLGHSMGAAISTHVAARHDGLLSSVLLLNMWIQETGSPHPGAMLSILLGGLFHSKRYWRTGDSTEGMTSNPEATRMLNADPYWQREQTVTMLLQTLFMRQAIPRLAKHITIPVFFLQGAADTVIVPAANKKFYDTLTVPKEWKDYAGYEHDSEFHADRSAMDNDMIAWLKAH